jgi:hypothetical protein
LRAPGRRSEFPTWIAYLRETDDIVFQHLAIDRLDAEHHLRLLIDENDLAVRWRQHFKFRITH